MLKTPPAPGPSSVFETRLSVLTDPPAAAAGNGTIDDVGSVLDEIRTHEGWLLYA